MKRLPYLIILIVFTSYSALFAGWSEPVRLTYRGNEINPQVVARNDTVHVVWSQALSAGQISYIRSTDNGQTWGNIIDLTEAGHFGQYAHLIVDSNKIWISWMDNNLESIAIVSSTNGNSWSTPIYKYTIDSQRWQSLGITVSKDTIFVVYIATTRDSTGLKPFKAMKSNDGGFSWSNLITFSHLQENASMSGYILYYCGGNLIFALDPNVDSLGGGPHIVGYVSYDKGDHWSDPILISPAQQAWALLPCLSCNQLTNQLAAGYMDYRYQQYAFYGDIFIGISGDSPSQWISETQVTAEHTSKEPSVSFQGTSLASVWSDRKYISTGADEIFYNSSRDGGITWERVQRLTFTQGWSYSPWISSNNDTVHLVWYEYDTIGNNYSDIYYMNYLPDSSDILSNATVHPFSFTLSAYPNPFNSTLSINISSEKSGELYITDILGRFITKIEYPKGTSTIKWNAINSEGKPIPSGAYFIKNNGGDYKNVMKVMYLK